MHPHPETGQINHKSVILIATFGTQQRTEFVGWPFRLKCIHLGYLSMATLTYNQIITTGQGRPATLMTLHLLVLAQIYQQEQNHYSLQGTLH